VGIYPAGKSIGAINALSNDPPSFEPAEIVSFAGDNGEGKSTLLRSPDEVTAPMIGARQPA
jgi:ABC-type sugar transport system ATPase subunit